MAQIESGEKMKYPFRRWCADKNFKYICYGSQGLNRINKSIDIQGTNIKKNGNYMSMSIQFDQLTDPTKSGHIYVVTYSNQMVFIKSDGTLRVSTQE